MSYTERFWAKARRFVEGVVADRCVSVGAFAVNIVERAGAEEFGWLKNVFSGDGDRNVLVSESLGDSTESPLDSNERGGRNEEEVLFEL